MKQNRLSLSVMMTGIITAIVFLFSVAAFFVFIGLYRNSVEQNAIISSEQAVVQVQNTVAEYTGDMSEAMEMIQENIGEREEKKNNFFRNLMEIRSDVVAVTVYDKEGQLLSCWSWDNRLKSRIWKNLSYEKVPKEETEMHISKPHVESLFVEEYPWVVTISEMMEDYLGNEVQIAMDIRFSSIANYVDEVGIGQHGYCFIIDKEGNLVYHPQQQLIYAGLKSEPSGMLRSLEDGSYPGSNVIYTISSLENCNWRIVGVSYVDELITNKVQHIVEVLAALLGTVIFTALISGMILSKTFSKPADSLAKAMEEFEKNGKEFRYKPVKGSNEIVSLSDSFGHMVLQVQELMEKVRQEEVTLRKTELNALQAQINPHFLYNTLDSIAWMCEEGRNKEAEEMVNALARLFRISISKGHELITLEKEVQHAESYLKIQKFRYKNRFTYSIQAEESCLMYLCNKITLQPIIENAIVHGLDLSDEGEIRIVIKEEGEDILITVTDNGIGMLKEQCREILQKESTDRTGIGIKNVNDRIRIYFGEKYGLHITSELDVGTCVAIRMPKILEENLHEG